MGARQGGRKTGRQGGQGGQGDKEAGRTESQGGQEDGEAGRTRRQGDREHREDREAWRQGEQGDQGGQGSRENREVGRQGGPAGLQAAAAPPALPASCVCRRPGSPGEPPKHWLCDSLQPLGKACWELDGGARGPGSPAVISVYPACGQSQCAAEYVRASRRPCGRGSGAGEASDAWGNLYQGLRVGELLPGRAPEEGGRQVHVDDWAGQGSGGTSGQAGEVGGGREGGAGRGEALRGGPPCIAEPEPSRRQAGGEGGQLPGQTFCWGWLPVCPWVPLRTCCIQVPPPQRQIDESRSLGTEACCRPGGDPHTGPGTGPGHTLQATQLLTPSDASWTPDVCCPGPLGSRRASMTSVVAGGGAGGPACTGSRYHQGRTGALASMAQAPGVV